MQRLEDLLEAIRRIESYAQRGRGAFDQDELLQTWMVHHLEIIGEVARALSDEARQAAPDIPWRLIIGMRNVLVHDYFGINLDEVWNSVERDLPPLRARIAELLERLRGADNVPNA